MFCSSCQKKIRAFTTTKDWAARPMHKTCWLRQKEEETIKRMMEDWEKTQQHIDMVLNKNDTQPKESEYMKQTEETEETEKRLIKK